jgi:hypothetical protein
MLRLSRSDPGHGRPFRGPASIFRWSSALRQKWPFADQTLSNFDTQATGELGIKKLITRAPMRGRRKIYTLIRSLFLPEASCSRFGP